jgi:hypothetical protein
MHVSGVIPPPPPPPPPSPPGPSGISPALSRFLFAFFFPNAGTSSSSSVFIPSLTATDVLQIFHYISFDIETDEAYADNMLVAAAAEGPEKTIDGTIMYAFRFGGDEIARLAKDGVVLGSNSGNHNINLQEGNVLLTPDRDVKISTKQGDFSIGAGATVFVMKSAHNVVLYDLLQTKPNQVSVVANNKKLIMEPGSLIALTNEQAHSINDLRSELHQVAYRRPEQVLSGSVTAFAANFSVNSAMNNIEPLKDMVSSPYKQDQLTVDRLRKNASIEGDFNIPDQPFKNATMGR